MLLLHEILVEETRSLVTVCKEIRILDVTKVYKDTFLCQGHQGLGRDSLTGGFRPRVLTPERLILLNNI